MLDATSNSGSTSEASFSRKLGLHAVSGKRRVWLGVLELRQSDLGSVQEVVSRYILVAATSGGMFSVTGNWLFLAWLASYVVTTGVLYTLLVRVKPANLAMYVPMIYAMILVTSVVYMSMPIYVWVFFDNAAFHTVALCAFAALAMFNMQRHRRWSLIAIWDCGWVVSCAALFAFFALPDPIQPAHFFVAVVGFSVAASYFVLVQNSTIRDRTELRRTRQKLIEDQKRLTMDQISAGIAHDFNNTLTAIQGNIELAAMTHDPVERQELLAQATKSTNRASLVVAEMRAYARKSRMTITRVDVEDFVIQIEEKARKRYKPSVKLDFLYPKVPLEIESDFQLLTNAVCHLMQNAREAIPEGSGAVSLTVRLQDKPERPRKHVTDDYPDFVEFIVRDSGPGIDNTLIDRVMDPFHTTKPPGAGTGLGLSMVKGFAEQSGGSLRLKNLPRGGLQARLTLPLRKSQMPDDTP